MFKIITDNGADLPKSWLKENDVDCIYLSTILNDKIIAMVKTCSPRTFNPK